MPKICVYHNGTCRAQVQSGKSYCWQHDPERSGDRTTAGFKAGESRRRSRAFRQKLASNFLSEGYSKIDDCLTRIEDKIASSTECWEVEAMSSRGPDTAEAGYWRGKIAGLHFSKDLIEALL